MAVVEPSIGAVVARLRELLGADGVAVDDAVLRESAYDALSAQRGLSIDTPVEPTAVTYPRSRDDVAAIVRMAAETHVAIVPYGGGSGLMGGARSVERGIVIDMRRMDDVRELDAVSRSAWVEAGTTLRAVDEALAPLGLMIGHDPWTYGIATVGGAISTNGLGFLGGKYGSMGDQVLAVEGVMADGTIVETRAVRPRSTGIDLTRLFIAGEGQFGVVTAAALRVFPVPESRVRIGFTFETFERGFEAILAMHAIGLTPALLDFGERPAAPDTLTWRRRDIEPPTLYLGFDGLREEVDSWLSRAIAICERHGGARLDEGDVEEFWNGRHEPAENFARNRTGRRAQPGDGESRCFDYIHVSLPASRVLAYREQTLAIAREHDVHVLEAGVWVSPGLFSLAMANVASSHGAAVERMSSMVDACLRAAHAMGGSMEYCHGVGVRLAHLMRDEHGAGLDVMRAVKRAVDPAGVLNPGKLDLDG